MLVHHPEPDETLEYVYYSVVRPNDDSSFAVCITQLIDKYFIQHDLANMKYLVNANEISNGVLSYLSDVSNELPDCSIEFSDDNNYIIKYRNVYCWITWTFEKDKYEFGVILGLKYSNTDLGIYVYGSEDDDATIEII
jgi:hypothetical protein